MLNLRVGGNVKSNIDLTIDRDFQEDKLIRNGVLRTDAFAQLENMIEEISYQSHNISQVERETGILTGTEEEKERKRAHLLLEEEMNNNCHRCSKRLDIQDTLEICLECDRELEIQVLGRL